MTIRPSDSTVKPDAYLRACPSRLVLARIGEKWSLLIVLRLAEGPSPFGALRRRLEGISQKVLTQNLRGLERDGLVGRRALPTRPASVEYRLTALGTELVPMAAALKAWAERNLHAIERHQRAYDAGAGGPGKISTSAESPAR